MENPATRRSDQFGFLTECLNGEGKVISTEIDFNRISTALFCIAAAMCAAGESGEDQWHIFSAAGRRFMERAQQPRNLITEFSASNG